MKSKRDEGGVGRRDVSDSRRRLSRQSGGRSTCDRLCCSRVDLVLLVTARSFKPSRVRIRGGAVGQQSGQDLDTVTSSTLLECLWSERVRRSEEEGLPVEQDRTGPIG